MITQKELLSNARSDVVALTKIHKEYWNEPRYQILKKFCSGSKKIISVGCGPKEPVLIGATHACDITPLSFEYLKKEKWAGQFWVAPCYDAGVSDKEFDVAVCSEVIEHLPDLELVKKTFLEISRISKKWIITTPNENVIAPQKQNKKHLQFFTPDSIKKIIPFPCKIHTNDHHIYMESL